MPSESSYKKHIEIAREALKNFTIVRNLKAPIIVKAAVDDLIDATIALYPFIPFFLTHAHFQEFVPAAFNALNNFSNDNVSFVMPLSMDRVFTLNNRVRGSLTQTIAKKGMNIHIFIFYALIIILFI